MASLLFLIAALGLFVLSIIRLFQKKIQKSFVFFLIFITSLFLSVITSDIGRNVASFISMKNQISGDAENDLEAYERMLNKKCAGETLEKCTVSSKDIGEIQTCMYSHYGEFSGECGMFLSNTALNYPPLSEDMVVNGISFPKGSILSMDRGHVASANIPKDWEFSNKHCAKGLVMFSHWEGRAENKIKVISCNE